MRLQTCSLVDFPRRPLKDCNKKTTERSESDNLPRLTMPFIPTINIRRLRILPLFKLHVYHFSTHDRAISRRYAVVDDALIRSVGVGATVACRAGGN